RDHRGAHLPDGIAHNDLHKQGCHNVDAVTALLFDTVNKRDFKDKRNAEITKINRFTPSKKPYNKWDFKACDARESGVYYT
ncbi:MAG: hypothetical protein IKM37_05925, partial [Alistipes sp.]|nr:hypothetical protein [Alistipes sp.]